MGVETIVWPAYEAGILPLDDPAIETGAPRRYRPDLSSLEDWCITFVLVARETRPSVELASTSPVYETDASLSTLTRRNIGDRSGTRTR